MLVSVWVCLELLDFVARGDNQRRLETLESQDSMQDELLDDLVSAEPESYLPGDEEERDSDHVRESEEQEDPDLEVQRRRMLLLFLRQRLLERGCINPDQHVPTTPVLPEFTLEAFATHLLEAPQRSVVVLCGAGISVAAGIPDFRTPGTGLYDNLAQYELPSPQAVFELSYFREHPEPFFRLARELWPENFSPTAAHHFIALLNAKGLLRRCFTQNIDSLETMAKVPPNLVVAAHGNFDGASCIETGEPVPIEEMREAIFDGADGPRGWRALAERYGGLVKPNIVFFGEQLPSHFFQLAQEDLPGAHAIIIMGTSLKVQPFASLVTRADATTPRLLINRELVGTADDLVRAVGLIDPMAISYGEAHNVRDVFCAGECDESVSKLAKLLGWEHELHLRINGGTLNADT